MAVGKTLESASSGLSNFQKKEKSATGTLIV